MRIRRDDSAVVWTLGRALRTLTLAGTVLLGAAAFAPAGGQRATYAEATVTIETGSPAVRLAGTLTVPNGTGPHPAMLLIQGEGPHTRD
jgi:hypothetical protein